MNRAMALGAAAVAIVAMVVWISFPKWRVDNAGDNPSSAMGAPTEALSAVAYQSGKGRKSQRGEEQGEEVGAASAGATFEHQQETQPTSQLDSKIQIPDLSGLVQKLGYGQSDKTESLARLFELHEKGFAVATPAADNWISMWEEQKFERVNQAAEFRLRENPKDMAGLLIRMEFAGLSMDVEQYYAVCREILTVLPTVSGTQFDALKATLTMVISNPIPGLTSMTQAELRHNQERLRAKIQAGGVSGHNPNFAIYLKALEADGLFVPMAK